VEWLVEQHRQVHKRSDADLRESLKSGIYWILSGLMLVVWGMAYNIWTEMRKKRTKQQSPGGRSE
jgi:hypothetical protein